MDAEGPDVVRLVGNSLKGGAARLSWGTVSLSYEKVEGHKLPLVVAAERKHHDSGRDIF